MQADRQRSLRTSSTPKGSRTYFSAAGIVDVDAVTRNVQVVCDEHELVELGLCDEQAIERIGVMTRQLRRAAHVLD